MGFLELDLQTRRATGACVLITIPNCKKQTLHQEITRYIEPGSLIFTDRFKSYQFLSSRNSAYVHLSTALLTILQGNSPGWSAFLLKTLMSLPMPWKVSSVG